MKTLVTNGAGLKVLENASAKAVPYRVAQRSPRDVAACYADTFHASQYLGLETEHDLVVMSQDHWNWLKQNPRGYV